MSAPLSPRPSPLGARSRLPGDEFGCAAKGRSASNDDGSDMNAVFQKEGLITKVHFGPALRLDFFHAKCSRATKTPLTTGTSR